MSRKNVVTTLCLASLCALLRLAGRCLGGVRRAVHVAGPSRHQPCPPLLSIPPDVLVQRRRDGSAGATCPPPSSPGVLQWVLVKASGEGGWAQADGATTGRALGLALAGPCKSVQARVADDACTPPRSATAQGGADFLEATGVPVPQLHVCSGLRPSGQHQQAPGTIGRVQGVGGGRGRVF